MTVWEVCLCGFRKEQTGAFYSSGDEFVSRSFACFIYALIYFPFLLKVSPSRIQNKIVLSKQLAAQHVLIKQNNVGTDKWKLNLCFVVCF
jgi:hypothetical protein